MQLGGRIIPCIPSTLASACSGPLSAPQSWANPQVWHLICSNVGNIRSSWSSPAPTKTALNSSEVRDGSGLFLVQKIEAGNLWPHKHHPGESPPSRVGSNPSPAVLSSSRLTCSILLHQRNPCVKPLISSDDGEHVLRADNNDKKPFWQPLCPAFVLQLIRFDKRVLREAQDSSERHQVSGRKGHFHSVLDKS